MVKEGYQSEVLRRRVLRVDCGERDLRRLSLCGASGEAVEVLVLSASPSPGVCIGCGITEKPP